MKLLKPHWVHHDEKPIFSVDIHPNCLKFATGGQGNDSGRVVIWNLLPVISEEAENDESIPKILCQMDNHLSCVNCCRWSQSGDMLASGSDDKLVMIWKMSKGSSGIFGTGGVTKNTETWKCAFTLRGHSGDVLDVAWSPGDRWLASCSVDNSIIVWDARSFPTMLSILKGHTGLVKGVAWDPVEKFLATQSDDRSIKIWKTSDWTCNNTITEPFEECGGTTHILRLSWSPDGQYLVSAHAMNGGGPTAQIIERDGWKCDKDFVGHRKAVTCVRFHSSILKKQSPKSKKSQQYCCLAVGSRDRSLSVWMTALQRPMVVVHDLFQESVLDLSWGPEKCVLLACSGDGTIACLQFSEKELGTPLSDDAKNSLYQRIYGKAACSANNNPERDMIIENAELLTVKEQLKPITINTNEEEKTIEISYKAEKKCSSKEPLRNNSDIDQQHIAINKQIETRTVDGKRRITPVFIPPGEECTKTISEFNSKSEDNLKNSISTETITNPNVISPASVSAKITNVEQAHLDNRLSKSNLPSAPAQSADIFNTSLTNHSNLKSHVTNYHGPVRLSLTRTVKNSQEISRVIGNIKFVVYNAFQKTPYGFLSKIYVNSTKTNEKLWEKFIGSQITNFCVTSQCILFCTLDGNIRFLNIMTGTAILPILSLTTVPVQCAFCPSGKLGGVISETGLIKIWDIFEKKIFLSTSCSEILKKGGQIFQFSIMKNGTPVVMFSNGNAYSFSKNMECWLVLNSKDPIMRHGLQTTIPRHFQKNIDNYPLLSIQASTLSWSQSTIDINSKDWQSSVKLDFIENQIRLSEFIDTEPELKYWYSVLAYHLTTDGTEKKMRNVLDDLVEKLNYSDPIDEKSELEKTKFYSILESMLDIIKSNSKWQRIYMEYNEQLKFINSKCSENS